MIPVELSFPRGENKIVQMRSVPREGDRVTLTSANESTKYAVTLVNHPVNTSKVNKPAPPVVSLRTLD